MRMIILLLAVVSNSAMALSMVVERMPTTWTMVIDSGNAAVYVDLTTIQKWSRKMNATVMWTLIDYKTAESIEGKPFMSEMSKVDYNCMEGQSRTRQSLFHYEKMGKGELVYNNSNLGNWEPVLPGTINDGLWEIACGKERSAQSQQQHALTRLEQQKQEDESQHRQAEVDRQVAQAAANGNIIFRDCPDCPEMVVMPTGSFDMGSNNGPEDEKPMHRVTIRHKFAMGKTEVTRGQWKAVMGENNGGFAECLEATCPEVGITWLGAQKFIQKLNTKTGKQYRLPTEAEWEYSCRAGGRQEYCGSDDKDSVAWVKGNTPAGIYPVATKQANHFGLYDMSGNVSEWVADSYHDNYNGAPTDGSAWQGDGAIRMHRGGSWLIGPQNKNVRAARRDKIEFVPMHYSSGSIGFRLARTLP